MSSIQLDILIQDADELSVKEVLEFVKEHENRKFVLIYSAIKDEMTRLNFFSTLVEETDEEFLACGVSGFITNSGYYNDHIAVCVFSGDFKAETYCTPIEFENLRENADEINEKIDEHELCLVHSANVVSNNYSTEVILRKVQERNPEMQIVGGVASPPQFLVTEKGIYNKAIAYTLFKGIDYAFEADSGFEQDATSTHEFEITKASGNKIYEINGRNASEEYQRIQNIRGYLLNQLVEITNKNDIVYFPQYFKGANKILFDAWTKVAKEYLVSKSKHGFISPTLVTQIDNDKIRANHKCHEGTVLKRNVSEPEKQLEVYDNLVEKHEEGQAMILIDCAMRLFFYNYQTDEAHKRLKKLDYPFIAPQVYGEIGNYTPYDPEENLMHNATLKSLVFK